MIGHDKSENVMELTRLGIERQPAVRQGTWGKETEYTQAMTEELL